jgi:hypothetical protein
MFNKEAGLERCWRRSSLGQDLGSPGCLDMRGSCVHSSVRLDLVPGDVFGRDFCGKDNCQIGLIPICSDVMNLCLATADNFNRSRDVTVPAGPCDGVPIHPLRWRWRRCQTRR